MSNLQKVQETIVALEHHQVSPVAIMDLLSEWLMGTCFKVDKEYSPFFNQKGVC